MVDSRKREQPIRFIAGMRTRMETHPEPMRCAVTRFAFDASGLSIRAFASRLSVTEGAVRHWLGGSPVRPDYMQAIMGYVAQGDQAGLDWGMERDGLVRRSAELINVSEERLEELAACKYRRRAKSETRRHMMYRVWELGLLGAYGWSFRDVRFIDWFKREILDGRAYPRRHQRMGRRLYGDPFEMVCVQPLRRHIPDVERYESIEVDPTRQGVGGFRWE